MSFSSDEDEDFFDDNDFEKEPADAPSDTAGPQPKKVTGLKHILALKSELGLDEVKSKQDRKREKRKKLKQKKKEQKAKESGSKVIETLATKVRSVAPEVIVYNDPRKRKKKPSVKEEQPAKRSDSPSDEVSMKQARFDVFKFAVSGMDRNSKQDAQIAHAIRLGAKPPKNKCYNYAEFKDLRKKEKEEAAHRKEMERISGVRRTAAPGKVAKQSVNKPKKKAKEGTQLKMGTFDGGMLRLSDKDLQKIKRKK